MILPDGRRLRLPWAQIGAVLFALVILANYGLGGLVLLALIWFCATLGGDDERSV